MSSETMISESEFKASLEAAVDQRAREYTRTFSLHIRFENGDTSAQKDAANFQSFLRAFALSQAEEYVIKPSEPSPGWAVKGKFHAILSKAIETPGRSLVLIHYAGHGGLDGFGRLVFQANMKESRGFRFGAALPSDVSETFDLNTETPAVDVVFMLDSCYSGPALRGVHGTSRVVEILAACEANTTTFWPEFYPSTIPR